MVGQNVGRLRRYDEFHLAIPIGNARHARRPASISHVARALSAFGPDGLEDGLVLRRERSRRRSAPGLALVISPGTADRAPLAAEIRILRIVPCLSIGNRDAQRCQNCDCTDRALIKHGCPTLGINSRCREALAPLPPTYRRPNKTSTESPRLPRGHGMPASGLGHSGLRPANFTTLAHFSVSAAMSLPKSAG